MLLCYSAYHNQQLLPWRGTVFCQTCCLPETAPSGSPALSERIAVELAVRGSQRKLKSAFDFPRISALNEKSQVAFVRARLI
jgi:hypothetical protein